MVLDAKRCANRYWCVFGTENPASKLGCLNITCEINPPFNGMSRRGAGLFARANNGKIFYCHTGEIGGGKKGVGKAEFEKKIRHKFTKVRWGDSVREMIKIGCIDDPNLLEAVSEFVWEVERFKRGKTGKVETASLPMKLSPLVFDVQFQKFKKAVLAEWKSDFCSFREGGPWEWESYKEDVRNEALRIMDCRRWKKSQVGSGKILKRVIAAIEINRGGNLRNNLVRWENRWGHKKRAHHALLDALKDRKTKREFEQLFLDFFQGRRKEADAFNQFCELAGHHYGLIAYFFFLKDWTRFMPNAPETFEQAFERMGFNPNDAATCSWESYARFNAAIAQVQQALREVESVRDARLIDAHSFLWMLVRLKVSKANFKQVIPLPKSAASVQARALPRAADPGESGDMSDEDFEKRNQQRRALGKVAQEIAFKSECRRLREDGRADLVDRVQDVSNRPTRGYDILSFELDGSSRHVEVKAARKSGRHVSFFLSENERRKSQTLNNYYFYLVFGCRQKKPEVIYLKSNQVSSDSLTPENYSANLSIG